MKRKFASLVMASALIYGAVGCAGPSNHTESGAGTGAILGGLAGGIIGHNENRRGAEGAALGALAGALLGGLYGNQKDKAEKSNRRSSRYILP